jgi:YVTN family beta-propeller protein
VKHKHCLLAVIVALCAATANAQFIEDSIDVGGAWVGSLAYNNREDVLYGRCQQAGIFFAISCDSNKVISSFALSRPRQMAYDSIDNKAYCPYEGADGESLAVIDGHTHTLLKRIGMPGATTAVWDVASDRVYVSCQSTNSVAVVDCATDAVLEYIPVGACPLKMYINTRRHKLYVLSYDDGTVSIVNMTTNHVIKTVSVGGNPNAGYYCRSADKFYSAGPQEQCVVIRGLSDTVVARIPLPGIDDILGASGNEDAGLVYVGTFTGHDDYVATVLAEKDSVIATALTGRCLFGVAYSDESGLLYSASAWSNEVYVLSGDGARVLGRLPVADYPFVFASAPQHRRLYLGHLGSRWVYVLRDTATGAVAEPSSPRVELASVSVTPNPFSQSVAIVWNSPAIGSDDARVYAQDGRLVRQARIAAGELRWVWDGRDDSGAPLPPGVYVIEAGPGVRAKVVKLK